MMISFFYYTPRLGEYIVRTAAQMRNPRKRTRSIPKMGNCDELRSLSQRRGAHWSDRDGHIAIIGTHLALAIRRARCRVRSAGAAASALFRPRVLVGLRSQS